MIDNYERVSTVKEGKLGQEMQLDKLGINFSKHYINKMCSNTVDRPQFIKMLIELKNDDILYCESTFKLGRGLKELTDKIEQLFSNGVKVVVLKEGIDTTRTMYKLLLGIFKSISQIERATIQEVEKCKESGITKTGNCFSRQEVKEKGLPKEFKKYYDSWKSKKITAVEFTKLLNTSKSTLYRWIKIYEIYEL